MRHTLCVTTVKMYLQKKVMAHPGIATNTMVLHSPISGMFANSVILLDSTELAKFNARQYKGCSEWWYGIHPTLTKQSTGTYVQRIIPAPTNHSAWDHYTLDVVLTQHSVPEQRISVLLTSVGLNHQVMMPAYLLLLIWPTQNLTLHEEGKPPKILSFRAPTASCFRCITVCKSKDKSWKPKYL